MCVACIEQINSAGIEQINSAGIEQINSAGIEQINSAGLGTDCACQLSCHVGSWTGASL